MIYPSVFRASLILDSYEELWEWSVSQVEKFWVLVWEFTGIVSSEPWQTVSFMY